MARAFALATEAGRLGYLAGRGAVREVAEASSPLTGFLGGTGFAPLEPAQ
jgi:thiazole synthase